MLLEVGYVLGFVLAGALGAGVEALAFVLMRVGSWSVNGRDGEAGLGGGGIRRHFHQTL